MSIGIIPLWRSNSTLSFGTHIGISGGFVKGDETKMHKPTGHRLYTLDKAGMWASFA